MLRRFLLPATSLIVWILARASRGFLLFPENTVLQAVIGVSIPVEMTERGGVVFSNGFQFNYILPWNVTQFEPTVIHARKSRELNLQHLYTSIEYMLEKHGWQRGRECLLRTICELAATPLDRSDLDVVVEMIYLLFTPSEDLSDKDSSNHQKIDELYLDAEKLGKRGGDCVRAYKNCIESPVELFTQIISP